MKDPLQAHFFRREYGRLVAMLARRVGVQHLDVVEDAVQNALLAAVETGRKARLQRTRQRGSTPWLQAMCGRAAPADAA